MKQYYFCNKTKLMELSLNDLGKVIKSIKSDIDKIDIILYTDRLKTETSNMTKRGKEAYIKKLTDNRYNLVRTRGTIESAYREKRLNGITISKKALSFGVYTDVHTPKIRPSASGKLAAISGITL